MQISGPLAASGHSIDQNGAPARDSKQGVESVIATAIVSSAATGYRISPSRARIAPGFLDFHREGRDVRRDLSEKLPDTTGVSIRQQKTNSARSDKRFFLSGTSY